MSVVVRQPDNATPFDVATIGHDEKSLSFIIPRGHIGIVTEVYVAQIAADLDTLCEIDISAGGAFSGFIITSTFRPTCYNPDAAKYAFEFSTLGRYEIRVDASMRSQTVTVVALVPFEGTLRMAGFYYPATYDHEKQYADPD